MTYVLIAQLVYFLSLPVMGAMSGAACLRDPAATRAVLTRPVLLSSGAGVLLMLAATAAAAVLRARGTLSADEFFGIAAMWLPGLLALVAVPLAVRLDGAEAPPRLAVAVGTGCVLAVGGLAFFQLAGHFVPIEQQGSLGTLAEVPAGAWILVPLALAAAALEEVFFRGVLQPLLAGRSPLASTRGIASIVLPSALWALGHAGMATPNGIKELQIFLLGLVFGAVRWRWGLAAAVVCHAAHNGLTLLWWAVQLVSRDTLGGA